MNESDALLVTALRAVETVDAERQIWSEEDRAWASKAAAEVVGEGASAAVFVARRARLAIERLRSRDAGFVSLVDGLRWRPWVAALSMLLAFVAGVAVDRIGAGQQINLLAPPVFGLLVWNLAVYALMLGGLLWHRRRGSHPGPLRRQLGRCITGWRRSSRPRAMRMPAAVATRLLGDWSQIAGPLQQVRLARILHFSAALFAAGIVVGLYLRGFAFEYRAAWQSTFLGAEAAHRILSIMLAPGAWLTGSALPDVAGLAAIRSGALPASENAAPWLHLMAATMVVVVIAPRTLLGLIGAVVERRRSASVISRFDDPYYQRLLHGYQAGQVHLTVIPYSYHPVPAAMAGLQRLVARIFGGKATMSCTEVVRYGDEESLPRAARPDGSGPAMALFSLAATPEREAQGAFVAALRAAANRAPLLVLVDEAPWHARFEADTRRLDERRSAWREELADAGVAPVFVDLAQADLAAAQDEIERRLEGSV
ncbi:MAG: DUF2868 domain-containing protein [Rhodobacteraceae bacterium]|nr:DUF2868 domain-containing protein [Paracoccaceae bacterium]